jgi:hypothetical protein
MHCLSVLALSTIRDRDIAFMYSLCPLLETETLPFCTRCVHYKRQRRCFSVLAVFTIRDRDVAFSVSYSEHSEYRKAMSLSLTVNTASTEKQRLCLLQWTQRVQKGNVSVSYSEHSEYRKAMSLSLETETLPFCTSFVHYKRQRHCLYVLAVSTIRDRDIAFLYSLCPL